MNPIDDHGRRGAPQPTWGATLSVNDPNAALLASVRPAPERSLETLIRRGVNAFSFDALAQGLHHSLPSQFASRKAAERGILGAIVGMGVGIGALIYIGATSMSTRAAVASNATSARIGSTLPNPEVPASQPSMLQHAGNASDRAAADGRRADLAQNRGQGSFTTALDLQQNVASLEPRAPEVAPPGARKPKAKRAAWKKKSKASTRRASQKRTRARTASQ